MRELIYTQTHPTLGNLKGVLRIIGKLLFFKFNTSEQSMQVISQLKSKGALIETSKDWIKVNMFYNQDIVKLGGLEFNISEKSEEEVEKILFDFYYNQFIKAKFKVDVI